MRRIAGISLLLIACACNTSSPPTPDGDESGFTSIAHLKTLCHGSSTLITEALKIKGIVTANDIRREFPKTIILEDASGGIEIAIDHTTLADLFPLGAGVTVYCSGLAVGEYGGKVQLRARPTGDYSVDRIARTDIDRHLRCTEQNAGTRQPRTVRIKDANNKHTDTYVRFEDIYFIEAGLLWCDQDPLTGDLIPSYRTLVDTERYEFLVRILPDCHYATEPMPQGTGSVNGIIDYFNGELSLRIINYEVDFATSVMCPTAYLSTAGYSILSPTR